MADRWSNPSGGIGVERFHVWPTGADSYDHAELAANWDELDDILGQPSDASQWPPTLGIDGGIYKLITLLQLERAPIGTVSFWYRPSTLVPLTTVTDYGWVVCDGSTLASNQHSFPGFSGGVVLPNLINSFVLGADPTKAVNVGGAAVGSGQENSPSGAPGVGGIGGENSHLLVSSEIPSGISSSTDDAMVSTSQSWPSITPVLRSFVKSVSQNTTASHPHENRPRWVGLIPIMKVMYVSSL